jgi:HSP20 family molecular chaperone IbpA
MAIKVQVKETGTNKVQPNQFNNGAYYGVSEFIGVEPTLGYVPSANTTMNMSWNTMPFAGISGEFATPWAGSANTFAANTLPYARQNGLAGQLPGLWQRNAMNTGLYGAQINPCFGTATMPALGVMPWAINGMTAPFASTMGVNAPGWNGCSINPIAHSANAQQAAICPQNAIAHLLIDILDDGIQYLLVADLPGVKNDDLELTVENGVLVIKAIVQSTTFGAGIDVAAPVATILREKAPIKMYQRAFVLGRDVIVEDITASVTNGVLTISLPKVNAITGVPTRIRNSVTACA